MILICLVLVALGVFLHYVAISIIPVVLKNIEEGNYLTAIFDNFIIIGCLGMGAIWEAVALTLFLEMLGY
jgi:hypothetical protein